MVTVILADEDSGKPGDDDVRTSETDGADHFFEIPAVAPVGEGFEDVLRSGVLAVEKPDMGDAEGGAGLAGFLFADVGESRSGFAAVFVGAAAAAGAVDDGDALVFI